MQLHALDLPQLILDLRTDLCRRFRFHLPQRRNAYLGWLLTTGVREYPVLLEADASLRHWLEQPATLPGLTRLQQVVWQSRVDVQQVFSLPEQLPEYLAWFFLHGIGEHGLWPWLTAAEQRQACLRDGPWQSSLLEQATHALLQEPLARTGPLPWGVNLIGYVHGQLGIGEDVRMATQALDAAGVPLALVNFKPGHNVPQNDQTLAHRVVDDGPYSINIFCLTAMEHGRFYAERGGRQLRGRYNIGYWPWELSQWPQQWQQLVHLVDEVWVSTNHTLEAVAPHCAAITPPVPVRLMPMAVTVEESILAGTALQRARQATRKRLSLTAKACLFCFAFDLNSSMHRKNPIAVLRAFLKAFPAPQWAADQVGLVIKVHSPKKPNRAWNELKALARQDDRLHIIEQTLPRPELLALYQACDCFVSLHRAEGFGRGLAEALQLGLRVIATDYSGNVDFCERPELADRVHLVSHRLVKVRQGQYPYPQGQAWANADIAHAAQYMQQVQSEVQKAGGALLPVPLGGWPVFSAPEVGQRYWDRLGGSAGIRTELDAPRLPHQGLGGGQLNAKPAEIKAFFANQLDPTRTAELRTPSHRGHDSTLKVDSIPFWGPNQKPPKFPSPNIQSVK